MHALASHPDISSGARLGASLLLAVLVHLIVILGVTFTHEDRPDPRVRTLDVVLVPPSSETPPDQPDFLAQANRDGGGDGIERVRTEAPGPAPPIADGPPMTAPAAATPAPPAESTHETDRTSVSLSAPAAAPAPAHNTSAASPMRRSLAIAALSAEIEQKLQAYAERPRHKWISARTREDKFAAYMAAWRRKVERIGNLNYPEEAARLGLSGSLLLEVVLNPDGTVADIELRRSSGHRLLDDAAVRIAQLAAPFARFPESIAEEVDVLHIQRTWVFHPDRRFSSP